ncbi:hypothetical protein PTSG_03499 [Salpingoeca rosetta]|uniref:SH3 domain-containing protein n=1 Tax=Salpingoeca rosetta (strain ATCC 50818 / BSB-021) TaxID=946362 RepID=F2U5S7_SALR5|nr:uncharacterized protein PTSG_03499 [Salpingoeca rosetta]EGD82868.1 hypothetical protein PTSG_03499 [Salpingoeca rosetta]|eukprot:XP_004995232.1 hypothetical protein PTSG_03499 [Salpingoeca rosetta]
MFRGPNSVEYRNLPDFTKKIQEANNLESVPNFWQVGEFKRAVQRLDAGATLLDDFSRLVLERAHIEKKYAQMLASWSKKWNDKITKGHEDSDGTLKPAWHSLLTEADQLSEVHANNDTQLRESVQKEVTKWRKSTYTRQLRGWRVTKDAHDQFVKAQKPWAKRMKTAKKSKKSYYAACQNRDSLKSKLDTAKSDPNLSEEDKTKLETKVSKALAIAHETRKSYEESINSLNQDRPRYETEMKKTFDFCEDIEQRRQDFFKEMMTKYHAILSRHTPEQCKDMIKVIEHINPDADLVRYRREKGIEMPLCVPPFQEYGSKPVIELVVDGSLSNHLTVSTTDLASEDEDDDEEWETDGWSPPPDPSVGRPVRAIYDYVAEDEEEISLRVGDALRLIEEEDEQGWCKGVTLDGSAGLFPACYVEDITEDAFDAIKAGRSAEC